MKFKEKLTAKRAAVVVAAAAAVALPLVWLVTQGQDALALLADGTRFRAWVDDLGALAPLAMMLLVVVQIVVAVLPGEPVELAAGYAFGALDGSALCLAGSALGTLAVVAFVRTLGMRAVELFFSREKIADLAWFRDARRFELALFLCFLIPGTPKDILTYVAALTCCPARRIVAITTVGRVPSVLSSTLAANFAATGELLAATVVFAVTLVLVAAGTGAYALVRHRGL